MADFVIPAEIIEKAKLDIDNFLIDFAVYLYDKERLSIGQARTLAQLNHIAFLREMKVRGVEIKLDVEDLHDELVTLKQLERIKAKR